MFIYVLMQTFIATVNYHSVVNVKLERFLFSLLHLVCVAVSIDNRIF